jgi:hypothetical protein
LNKYNSFKNHLEGEAVGEADNENEQNAPKVRNFWVFADVYQHSICEVVRNKL